MELVVHLGLGHNIAASVSAFIKLDIPIVLRYYELPAKTRELVIVHRFHVFVNIIRDVGVRAIDIHVRAPVDHNHTTHVSAGC